MTSARANFAAIKSLTFDFSLATEHGSLNQTDRKTVYKTPALCHGTVYWKEGSVAYHVEGNFPFRKPYPDGPVFVLKKPKVYSVLRTHDMLAYTEENAAHGLVLTVVKPPASASQSAQEFPFAQHRKLDPWLHYAQSLLAEQKVLRDFWGTAARSNRKSVGGRWYCGSSAPITTFESKSHAIKMSTGSP